MASANSRNLPGTLAGVVTDVGFEKLPQWSNKPIADALVELYVAEKPVRAAKSADPVRPTGPCIASVHTDASGRYCIENLEPGTYCAVCPAFLPQVAEVVIEAACTTQQDFEIPVGLKLSCVPQSGTAGACGPLDKNCAVEAGTVIKLQIHRNPSITKPTVTSFTANQGRLMRIPGCDDEMMLLTDNVFGSVNVQAKFAEEGSPSVMEEFNFMAVPGTARSVQGQLGVTLQRSASVPTPDMGLWAAIRSHERAISFGGIGGKGRNGQQMLRGYQGFIEQVLCGDPSRMLVPDDACERHPGVGLLRQTSADARQLPMHGMAAYELLKTATEIFLLWNCGVAVRSADAWNNPITTAEEESARTGLPVGQVISTLEGFLGKNRLPYIERVVGTAFPGYVSKKSLFCTNALTPRADCVCLIELIWSYWHEEAMLVQTMNAISQRFQNVRGLGDRDPLAHVTIDPLRPLNNLLWGYVQDEPNRLSVKRRSAEYDHEYGITLRGKAMANFRPADSRSKFLEGFHNLLHKCALFYKEDNDTTVIADGFALLNALKEVHLLLAQGAHNQFGDLPWAARVEMLVQQWLLARPEMRDFLQSRPMVPYTEAWMPQVDTMKTMQGWSDVTVTHYHDLATFGEQLLLSIRYGDWIGLNDENHAKNWARYWRPEAQGYIHAYRTVTGIDLTNPDTIDATMPGLHLQKRLAMQRAR